ncbi:MAG: carbohydrate ABC transporter permease [Caldilineaceae bacterium]
MGELTLEQRRLTTSTQTTTYSSRWVGTALLYAGFIVLTAIFITPIIWLLLTSLKTMSEYARYPLSILPDVAQWGNYYTAVIEYPFMRYALNSLLIAVPSTLLTVLSSALAGFGFARHRAPYKKMLFILVLSMMMVPRMVTVIPTFVFFSKLGLTNTYWPWILWGVAGSPFHIFLFRQFFAAIPKDLEDAAEVDGCSRLRIFWQIFLPLSGPVLATSAIFHFQWVWGDWFTPNIFLTQDRTTLSVLLSTAYRDPHGNSLDTVTMAAIMVYMLPMLLIFLFAQKYIVQGIVTSGIKG